MQSTVSQELKEVNGCCWSLSARLLISLVLPSLFYCAALYFVISIFVLCSYISLQADAGRGEPAAYINI